MTTEAPEPPPSPTSARERYATTATIPSRDSTPLHKHQGSFYSSLAVKCAHLPNSSVNAFCGASAGIASGIVTCPLDVIKTRLQSQGSFRPRNPARPSRAVYRGLVGTARVIWTEDGVRGMYRGLGPMLLGYIPTWAVYMSVYDYSKDFFYMHIGWWTTFSCLFIVLINLCRQPMDLAHIRVRHSGCMLDTRYKPHMGHQNETHVPSKLPHSRRISTAVAIQEYIRCLPQDVHE